MASFPSDTVPAPGDAHSQKDTQRSRDPEARRKELLSAARSIAIGSGLGSLTHRAAAQRAGLAVGTATKYFPSIDEFRRAVLDDLADDSSAEVDQMRRDLAGLDREEALNRTVEIMDDFLNSPDEVQATLSFISAHHDEALRALALDWTDRMIEVLAEHFGAAAANAIEMYVDGATVHAAIRGKSAQRAELETTIRAIVAAHPQRSA